MTGPSQGSPPQTVLIWMGSPLDSKLQVNWLVVRRQKAHLFPPFFPP